MCMGRGRCRGQRWAGYTKQGSGGHTEHGCYSKPLGCITVAGLGSDKVWPKFCKALPGVWIMDWEGQEWNP